MTVSVGYGLTWLLVGLKGNEVYPEGAPRPRWSYEQLRTGIWRERGTRRDLVRRLENKRAIVTGAGAGIGRAIALRMAKAGARLAPADVDEASAEHAAGARA